ncbi:MAG: UvrD-helicase domain-containing protein [Nitrospirae bacterium]|nr:UvrD-helicase domain-containing protein [Nitrospirota bacterium]
MTETADAAARARALDPAVSFIVQAPAGSGKTSLLVQRILVLLAVARQPEEVVAITFTRKAAGEMRERVVRALAAAHEAAPAAPHERVTWELARAALERDRERGWHLAESPGRLRILTFDALWALIARQMPYLSRLGGDPSPADVPAELYHEAARRTVARLDDGGPHGAALESLLAHLDGNVPRARDMIASMLGTRDQWLSHVLGAGDAEAEVDRLEAALERLVADALAEAARALGGVMAEGVAEMAAHAARNLPPDRADAAAALAAWRADATGAATLPAWRAVANLLLTGKGEVRKKVEASLGFPAGAAGAEPKRRMLELLDALRERPKTVQILGHVASLPDPCYPESQRRMLLALFTVLPQAVAELTLVFAAHGRVDFPQVAAAARYALGGEDDPTDLALALDNAIRHLLVDEFQDTSRGQYEMLTRLTAGWAPGDGHTLFLVGDPMQSVYSFREAEVGLYLKARREGIGQVKLEYLCLSTNFRSVPAVVGWVNGTFARVFPAEEDMGTGAVTYAPCSAASDAPGEVAFWPIAGKDVGAEAACVTALAREALKRHAAADRPERPRTAILVRARPHLAAILPALRAAQIPYRAVEIDPLQQRPAVADLIALTRALRDPADRIAWLAVLRAPWCGLTLADLHALAGGDRRTVADMLADPATLNALSPDGRARALRAGAVLNRALTRRGRLRAAPWVEETWYALWGPATLRPDDLDDATRYLTLLDGLDEPRLGGDLPSPARLAERLKDLFAADGGQAPVEVMTIHRAKGLEFDTVILCGLGRAPHNDDPRLLLWLERPIPGGDTDVLLAPVKETGGDDDALFALLKSVARRKGELEAQRLLYVAATRARTRLHLVAHAQHGNDGWSARGGSLLRHLWGGVGHHFDGLPPVDGKTAEKPAPQPLRRLPLDYAPPNPAEAVAADGPAPAEGIEITYDWAGELARHVGTVVHRALQWMAGRAEGGRPAAHGAGEWDDARIDALRPRLGAALTGLGLPPARHPEAVARIRQALSNTLADPRGRWLLGARGEAVSEWAVSGVLGGAVARRVIDRSFVDDGVRWIVDFKTGVHGGDVEAFLNEEQRRYRPQLEEYARLVSALDGRPIRLGLYFPLLGGWREWPWRG